jgi:hypothetical protein
MYKVSKKAIKDCLWLYKNSKEFFDSLPRFNLTRNRPVTTIEVSEKDLDKMIEEGTMFISISTTVPMRTVKQYADLKDFSFVFVKATDYKKIYKHLIGEY